MAKKKSPRSTATAPKRSAQKVSVVHPIKPSREFLEILATTAPAYARYLVVDNKMGYQISIWVKPQLVKAKNVGTAPAGQLSPPIDLTTSLGSLPLYPVSLSYQVGSGTPVTAGTPFGYDRNSLTTVKYVVNSNGTISSPTYY